MLKGDDVLQKALERVMILKRRANSGWRTSDHKHVLVLNKLIDFRDSGGERVVTLEPDPRHMDLLRKTCGPSAKSRAVTTADNYDEALLSANEATAFRSSTMRLAFVAADIPVPAFVATRLGLAKPTVGAWNRLYGTFLNTAGGSKHFAQT